MSQVMYLSFVWFKELQDSPADRGFSAPALSHQAEGFALFNVKVNTVDRLDPSDNSLKKTSMDRKVFLEPFNSKQAVI